MSVVPQPPSYQEAQILAQAQAVASGASVVQDVGGATTIITVGQPVGGAAVSEAEALQVENYKQAIYRHPLFPLMALLFEKCEQASHSHDCPTSESFDVDIQAFVQHQEKEHKAFFSDDNELDNLMVKAIQVLRIHLLELEKVNELCKDFCTRYIACLKGKLQSENLLRIDNIYDDSSPPLPGTPQPSQPTNPMQVQQQVVTPGVVTSVNGNVVIQKGIAQPTVSMATINQGQIVSGNTVYQMVHTPQGIVAQPIQIQSTPSVQAPIMTPTATVIHGSTPLSQIGVVGAPVVSQVSTPTASVAPQVPSQMSAASLSALFDDDDFGKKKSKRGVLPKQATQVMKTWLFQHIVHPYPTEDEKRQIASQTNLTLLQVNNWFINARRRILQPMLDASNPETTKTKKSKPQTRPQQRFWPDSIANITPQLPAGDGQLCDNQQQHQVIGSQGQPIVLPVMTEGQIITSLPNIHHSSSSPLGEDEGIKMEAEHGGEESDSSKDDN
ncbi:LOW QUALITY PROTEIN: homeobox protein PKNOX1-like [Haliotis rubra]|uniref:LOW QUALITY PROTEIN: homeobox protein PKNOX1-like n=1 Tax=Haliotis rubra TaxID=36100 RepID=UPI001EE512FB|nr:LOW QUALITY PROTEIN: homeobox protein PKNOX1-like [Haliotis rubra]